MKAHLVIALSLALPPLAWAADAVDQDFVTKAGQGGLAEVQLGKVATEHAAAADVKQFGQRMVDDHSKANEELKATAAKVGARVPDAPSAEQKATIEKLSQLSGGSFDKAYAKDMVADHKEDIDLFKKEAASGRNSDLKAFAQKTLPTLESHLQMAESLTGGK